MATFTFAKSDIFNTFDITDDAGRVAYRVHSHGLGIMSERHVYLLRPDGQAIASDWAGLAGGIGGKCTFLGRPLKLQEFLPKPRKGIYNILGPDGRRYNWVKTDKTKARTLVDPSQNLAIAKFQYGSKRTFQKEKLPVLQVAPQAFGPLLDAVFSTLIFLAARQNSEKIDIDEDDEDAMWLEELSWAFLPL